MIFGKRTCFIIAVLFMSAFLLGTFLSINVLAADNIPSNENLQELKLGQSPLVDEYNSKAAEESRIAAQDDSSEFVKYIKNTYQKISNSFNNSFIKNSGWKLLLKGLLITIEISFFAVILGIFLGFLIGIIRSTYDKTGRFRFLNSISKIYITVIRGTPVVVQLMIIYFVIFQNVDVSRIVAAIIAFGINSGAYVAEIFRSGIMSIDNGQMEAGRSLGLTYSQSMRSIIMPQALKNVLPALGNELIVLLKETSVAGYIALGDLTRVGDSIKTTQYENFWPLFGVAAIYLSIVMGLTKLLSILERRLRASDSR